MNKVHPNAIGLFFLQGLFISFLALEPLVLIIVSFLIAIGEGLMALFTIFLSLVPILGLAMLWAYFYYQSYKYALEDKVIKIERGVIWKRQVSIPYERVQNVDIIRGPIARMLGLADLQIQTAGMSGIAMVEGRIPAITPEEAMQLKDQILAKVSGAKNQGL